MARVEISVPEAGLVRLRALSKACDEAARVKEQADRELAAYLEGLLVGLGHPGDSLVGLAGDSIIIEETEQWTQ